MGMIALPPGRGIGLGQKVTLTLERNGVVNESPLSRAVQRIVRQGDRWRAAISWPPQQGVDAGLMAAFLDQASDFGNWFCVDAPRLIQGAWSTPNLVPEGDFQSGLSTWNKSGDATGSLSINARKLRISNGTAETFARRNGIPWVAGKPLVAMADLVQPWTTSRWGIRVQETAGGSATAALSFSASTRGLLTYTPAAGVTGGRLDLRTQTATAGDRSVFANASLARCLLVSGAGQSGSQINVNGCDPNIAGALAAGQFVTIVTPAGFELKRLTDDFDADGNGAGILCFSPSLRQSPADGAAIVVHAPFMRAYMPAGVSAGDIDAPMNYGFSIEALEDVTP
ncbi:hypothetical protein [Hydrocarboniphaga sp.]|uniref:hypothetical protein n=1 Tax=Hydrocarboniphaga sp. TaxID=2033016 RepID=UPI003D0AE434